MTQYTFILELEQLVDESDFYFDRYCNTLERYLFHVPCDNVSYTVYMSEMPFLMSCYCVWTGVNTVTDKVHCSSCSWYQHVLVLSDVNIMWWSFVTILQGGYTNEFVWCPLCVLVWFTVVPMMVRGGASVLFLHNNFMFLLYDTSLEL